MLPHWGGGGPESSKEFRAELSPAQSRTSSHSTELEEGELPQAESIQVDAISLNLDQRAQAHDIVEYMTQRSPKRRRAEDLQCDPNIECEEMEPVSHALRGIIASARTNLAAEKKTRHHVIVNSGWWSYQTGHFPEGGAARGDDQMTITVYFSYHMKPKPKARIAKSVSIVSPTNNIRS